MWFMVLLSVLLVNGAFFLPNYFGFLILFFWIPVFLCAMNKNISFTKGIGWGLGVFGPHFVWMFCVLYYKSQASWWLAFLLYSLVVTVFSLSSGVWWWVMGVCVRLSPILKIKLLLNSPLVVSAGRILRYTPQSGALRTSGQCIEPCGLIHKTFFSKIGVIFYQMLAFIVPTIGYYWYFTRYAIWFTGQVEGYPFLNPLIPLIHYKWVMIILVKMGALLYGPTPVYKLGLTSPSLCYVLPEKREEISALMRDLYNKLSALKRVGDEQLYVVAPESSCPISLNKHPELVKFLHSALRYDDHLFIGSQAEESGKYYQTVYWITQRRIINFYVKKHRVVFTEKIPKFWRKNILLRNMFLRYNVAFSKHCPGSAQVFDTGMYVVIPQICSEFFFNPDIAGIKKHVINDGRLSYVFLFVNDSWFVSYFRDIIERLARVNGAFVGRPVVYISHTQLTQIQS